MSQSPSARKRLLRDDDEPTPSQASPSSPLPTSPRRTMPADEPRVGDTEGASANKSASVHLDASEKQPKKKNKSVTATPLTKHGIHEAREGMHESVDRKLDRILAEQGKISTRLVRLEESHLAILSQLRALQGTTWDQVKVRSFLNIRALAP